jgi:hypothetical protein
VEISKIEAGIVINELKEVDVQARLDELIRFFFSLPFGGEPMEKTGGKTGEEEGGNHHDETSMNFHYSNSQTRIIKIHREFHLMQ